MELLLEMGYGYLLGVFIKRRGFHSGQTVDYYCAIQDFAVNLSGWTSITLAMWL